MTDADGFAADLDRSLGELRGVASGFAAELGAATQEMRAMDREATRLSRSLGSSLKTALDRAIFSGKGLGDVMRGLAKDVVRQTFSAAVKPVTAGLASGFGGLFGSLSSALGFADGAAFSSGRVRAFAKGGVVGGPVTFPMRGGVGLMGEAGPEAIMPLTRGPDGRLGVRAEGRGSAQVIINIQTQDAESFRRSRGQVSAQLARAVSRGNRGL